MSQPVARELPVPSPLTPWGGVAISAVGRVAVWDQVEERILILESIGSQSANVMIGRYGKGPGEFEVLSGMGWLDSTLWAYDARNGNLLEASPPQWRVSTRRLSLPRSIGDRERLGGLLSAVNLVGRLSVDEFVLSGIFTPVQGQTSGGDSEGMVGLAAVAWNVRDGQVRPLLDVHVARCLMTHREANRRRTQRIPFCDDPQATVDPEFGAAVTGIRNIGGANREVIGKLVAPSARSGTSICIDTITAPPIGPTRLAEVRGALRRQEQRMGKPNLVRSSGLAEHYARLLGGAFDDVGRFWYGVESATGGTVVLACGGPERATRRIVVGPILRIVGRLHGSPVAILSDSSVQTTSAGRSQLVWLIGDGTSQ